MLVAGIWAVVRFVSPMPPRTLAMSTGIVDGAYHHYGLRYREILRANGIKLELRTSSGGIENLARLNDGSVSAAFVQGGTGLLTVDADAPAESTPLRSLATIAYEPVWIFTHARPVEGLDVLAGRRVAVGVPGSGSYKVPQVQWPMASKPTANRPHRRRSSAKGLAVVGCCSAMRRTPRSSSPHRRLRPCSVSSPTARCTWPRSTMSKAWHDDSGTSSR
jgi:hypothetical protein